MITAIKRFFQRDEGFSLLEVSMATAIMAIGMAIAVPSFGNALNTASQNEVKTNLLQAGLIVENARYSNEGLYPTDVPEEILASTAMSDFTYTYNDDQDIYCLMGRTDTREKWYFGSEYSEPYVPTEEQPACTQKNLGVGSKALGTPPVMVPPVVEGNNVWDFTDYNYASANISGSASSCTPDVTDTDPGKVAGTEFQTRIVNLSTGETIHYNNGAWSSQASAREIALTGWNPDDDVSYEIRMRCNYDYDLYYADWATAQGVVDKFPVSGSLVANSPAPTIEWTSTQQYAVLSYTGTPTICPDVATPAYRAVASQSGKADVTGQWGNSTAFNLSLTGFVPNTIAEFIVESGCKIGSVYYTADSAAITDIPGVIKGSIMVPAMAPAPVTGLNCVTKYNRSYESSRGNCEVNAAMGPAETTPEAITWNYTACASGFSTEYFVRRASPTPTEWVSNGSSNLYRLDADTPVTAGSQITYEVKSLCNGSGISSAYSDAASKTFVSSWSPPVSTPVNFTWTATTDDNSWTSTNTYGDAKLNDRIIGSTTQACANGTTPLGYVVTLKNVNTGQTVTAPLNSSTLVINRSAWAGSNTVWAEGADLQVSASVRCADPFGDYSDSFSTASTFSQIIPVGYTSPAALTQVDCVSKYQRNTEAVKGNCVYDASVAAQAYTPDLIRWAPANCYTGYTGKYLASVDGGQNWSDLGSSTSFVPTVTEAGKNYNVQVKYRCENGARYSEYSSVTSKDFTSSLKPAATTAIAFSWTPSTAGDSFTVDSEQNGNYLYDTFIATASQPCSNGSAPVSYNLQVDRSGKGTPQTVTAQSSSTVLREQIQDPDLYWPMGSKMTARAQAVCGDPYGDYSDVVLAYSSWSPEFNIGITAPEAPTIGTNNYWAHFTWGGSSCAYVPNSSLQYYATQTQYGTSYGNWAVYGWGAGTEGDVPNYSEGSAISTSTVARCVSDYGIASSTSTPAVQSWTSGINGSTYVYMPRMYTGGVDGVCRSGTWETGLRQYARSAAGINQGWFGEKEHQYTGTWGGVYAVSGYSTCTNGVNSSPEHHGYHLAPGYPDESMAYVVY